MTSLVLNNFWAQMFNLPRFINPIFKMGRLINSIYTTLSSIDLAQAEKFCAKVYDYWQEWYYNVKSSIFFSILAPRL